jgi:hypothetical protein
VGLISLFDVAIYSEVLYIHLNLRGPILSFIFGEVRKIIRYLEIKRKPCRMRGI